MTRIRSLPALVAALALAGTLLAGPTLRADDGSTPPAGGAGEPKAAKDGDGDGKAAPQDGSTARTDRTTRLEVARGLVKELEATLTILKAAKTADAETIRALERALEAARKLAKPITAEELTDEERTRLAEELAKPEEPREDAARDNPWADWRERLLASAFKDADLSEEEQLQATGIINAWWDSSDKARRAGDSKAVSDAKRQRDEQLTKALGRKKGMKVVNNLNSMSGWKR